MLFDTAPRQGVFGLANLALALSTLDNQDERIADLVGRIEANFDSLGNLTTRIGGDYYYWGSSARTKAQAALALIRLRPKSKTLPHLVEDLAVATRGYTTQSTAFALLPWARPTIVSVFLCALTMAAAVGSYLEDRGNR